MRPPIAKSPPASKKKAPSSRRRPESPVLTAQPAAATTDDREKEEIKKEETEKFQSLQEDFKDKIGETKKMSEKTDQTQNVFKEEKKLTTHLRKDCETPEGPNEKATPVFKTEPNKMIQTRIDTMVKVKRTREERSNHATPEELKNKAEIVKPQNPDEEVKVENKPKIFKDQIVESDYKAPRKRRKVDSDVIKPVEDLVGHFSSTSRTFWQGVQKESAAWGRKHRIKLEGASVDSARANDLKYTKVHTHDEIIDRMNAAQKQAAYEWCSIEKIDMSMNCTYEEICESMEKVEIIIGKVLTGLTHQKEKEEREEKEGKDVHSSDLASIIEDTDDNILDIPVIKPTGDLSKDV